MLILLRSDAPYLIYTILFLSIYLTTTIMHMLVCVSNIRCNSKMFKYDTLFLFTIVKIWCVRANCQMNLYTCSINNTQHHVAYKYTNAYNETIVN